MIQMAAAEASEEALEAMVMPRLASAEAAVDFGLLAAMLLAQSAAAAVALLAMLSLLLQGPIL